MRPARTRRLSPHELHDVLHMVRVGKHVDGLHGLDAVGGVHQLEVAGLRGGVAAHIDDPFGRGAQDDFDHPVRRRPRAAGRG